MRWWSIAGCPLSTGSPSLSPSAEQGHRCRCSSSRPWEPYRTKSEDWTPEPLTTWLSRSSSTNCSPAPRHQARHQRRRPFVRIGEWEFLSGLTRGLLAVRRPHHPYGTGKCAPAIISNKPAANLHSRCNPSSRVLFRRHSGDRRHIRALSAEEDRAKHRPNNPRPRLPAGPGVMIRRRPAQDPDAQLIRSAARRVALTISLAVSALVVAVLIAAFAVVFTQIPCPTCSTRSRKKQSWIFRVSTSSWVESASVSSRSPSPASWDGSSRAGQSGLWWMPSDDRGNSLPTLHMNFERRWLYWMHVSNCCNAARAHQIPTRNSLHNSATNPIRHRSRL